MARSRNIRPGFMTNEHLPELGMAAHLLYPMLWMIADKAGRLEDRPKRIKGECMPYYDVDADELLDKLASGEDPFIRRYRVGDKKYIQIIKWRENQSPHHTEKDSVIPASPLDKGELSGDNGERTSVEPHTHYPQSGISNKESVGGSGGKSQRPTLDEVRAYVSELGYSMDAEKFWHHFEARGWRTREGPLKSWKSAVVNWQKNEKDFRGNRGTPTRKIHRHGTN